MTTVVSHHHHDSDSSSSSLISKQGSRGSSKTEITTTATEEEKVVAIEDHRSLHARNRCVSWWIIVLAHCGVICGAYATLSCEWFAWAPVDDDVHAHGVFAMDGTANRAESVGLFRYYYHYITDIDDDQNKIFKNTTADIVTCRWYASDLKDQKEWTLIVARDIDPWMFAAQLSWVIATLLAGMSLLATFYRVFWNYHWNAPYADNVGQLPCCGACGWLLASGLQAASLFAATSICGGFDFWECPWLQGAHASAGAAWFYLLCWLLSMCGYQHVVVAPNLRTINHYHHHHHHHHHKNNNSTTPTTTTTSIARCGKDEEEKQEIDAVVDVENKMMTEELLGTVDPSIDRAVGQKALVIQEFTMAGRYDTEDNLAVNSKMDDDLETTRIQSEPEPEEQSIDAPNSQYRD